MKFAIYQQGARGYGRIARSIKLINVLNEIFDDNSGIIFSGDSNIYNFSFPKGVDIIKIPEIYKGLNKNYSPTDINIDLQECLSLRSNTIKSAIINFEPEIFFIDSLPTGVLNEIKDLIIWLRHSSLQTKIILVTRDILDSPEKTIEEWTKLDIYNFLEEYYDMIFVLGSIRIFDFCKEYQIPQKLIPKVIQCNYFSSEYIPRNKLDLLSDIDILITLGGGIDGYDLVDSFIKLYKEENWISRVVIILGHQFPIVLSSSLSDNLPQNIEIITYTDSLLNYYLKSKQIICMGGYNTLTELIALGKKPIVIPRKSPTLEQFIRASKFDSLSLLTIVNDIAIGELKDAILKRNERDQEGSNIIEFNLNEIVGYHLRKILQ